MNQERDQARTHIAPSTPTHDDDLAPGRGSRSSRMDAPARPIAGGLIQRKARDVNADITAQSWSASGWPMPGQLQLKMESAFGADFSAVRIHEGSQAGALGALAYTQGADIHFAPGQYQPETRQGQELLGHELTHVVQQAQGRVQATTQAKGVALNDDRALETEADEMGVRAARGDIVVSHTSTTARRSGVTRRDNEIVQEKCEACNEKQSLDLALSRKPPVQEQNNTKAGEAAKKFAAAPVGARDPNGASKCEECGTESAPAQAKLEHWAAEAPASSAGILQMKTDIIQVKSAARGSVVQRLTEAEKAEDLKSTKFAGNARLEAAFDNSPAMRLGEPPGEPVRLVQEALVNAGFSLPASTTPSGELDGIFGSETQRVVTDFQGRFHLPSHDGIVGRQTLGKLDELAGAAQPVPPQPRQPAQTNAAQQVATANAARIAALNFAIMTMIALEQALVNGVDAAAIRAAFPATVAAIERWLKAKPEDPDFASTVTQAKNLLSQNLGASSGIGFPPASDGLCGVAPCAVQGFGCTNASGVNVCQGFLTSNLDCQRDVLLHEFNHFIGMHKERSDRGSVTKPADAFDNADSMAEFVTELAGSPTDRCSSP